MNPTDDVFEKRLTALEGGVGALATSSGQAATTLAILNIARAGDDIVALDNLYGGTYNLFHYTLPRLGVNVKLTPSADLEAIRKAIGPKTKALYAESIGNPKLDVTDLEALASIAHSAGIPFILDNTVSPFLLRPFEHGVDIVVYSGDQVHPAVTRNERIGGAIIDFPASSTGAPEEFPLISEPDPSYHGLDFIQALAPPMGNIAYIIKARVTLQRDLGAAALALQFVFCFCRGWRRCTCGCSATPRTRSRSRASWSSTRRSRGLATLGWKSSEHHAAAKKYLPRGAGAILGFGIRGDASKGKTFVEALKLTSHLANVGDAKTLVIQPALTTHQQLSAEEQAATGVTPDYVRLSHRHRAHR